MSTFAKRIEVPLWTPLASLALAAAWLIPNISNPWVAFQKDFLAGLVMLGVALALAARHWRTQRAFGVDAVALVLALIALLPVLQWAAGQVYFAGHAAVGLAYFLAAASLVVAGRAWEGERRHAVGDFLFIAFVIGALGTAALMFMQSLQFGARMWALGLEPGGRPYGNLLQPNNAATLLLLGLIGLFWMAARRWTGAVTVCVAGLPLVVALALSQSRAGYLAFLLLAGLGIVLAPRLFDRRLRWCLAVLLACFALAVGFVLAGAGGPAAAEAGARAAASDEYGLLQRPNGRLTLWRAFIAVALQHPLTGLGFLPGLEPHVAAAGAGYVFPQLSLWSHNAFLDIALWFGFPAAIVLLAVSLFALRRLWRRRLEADTALYAAAVLGVGLHAMVELPLAYAYFLLPFALLVGALGTRIALPAFRFDARAFTLLVVLQGGLLLTIARDYLEVERSVYAWRFMSSRIGTHHAIVLPDTVLLHQYRAYIMGVRLPPQELDAGTVRDFEQAVKLEPSPAALHALVILLVDKGDIEGAQRWADAARATSTDTQRQMFAAGWRQRIAADSKYAQVHWRP